MFSRDKTAGSTTTKGAARQRVLYEATCEVRPGELLELEVRVFAVPTGDEKRDARAALLSVFWLDKERTPLDIVSRGFTKSEEHGNFRYIAIGAAGEEHSVLEVLNVPPKSSYADVRLLAFSNPTFVVREALLRRTLKVPATTE